MCTTVHPISIYLNGAKLEIMRNAVHTPHCLAWGRGAFNAASTVIDPLKTMSKN
jgi:hypothetical protein